MYINEIINYNNYLYYPLFTFEIQKDNTILIKDFLVIEILKSFLDYNFTKKDSDNDIFLSHFFYENNISKDKYDNLSIEVNENTKNSDYKGLLKSLLYSNHTFKSIIDNRLELYNFEQSFNFKTNKNIKYLILNECIYLLNDDNTIKKANNQNTFYITYEGNWGDRIGNNLFGFFKCVINIFNFLIISKENIENIFIFNKFKILNTLKNYIINFSIFEKYTKININLFNYNYHKPYEINDLFEVLNKNNTIKYKLIEFINIIFNNKKYEKKQQTIISLHYRLSDFCAGDIDNIIFNNNEYDVANNKYCFLNNNSKPKNFGYKSEGQGISFNILSFHYYLKCITKIISNNSLDQSNYTIIIYYLQTNIDNIIIKLLIKYIKSKFPNINIITENEYYKNQKIDELDLIYYASLNDYLILSNSTFSFWMIFFKIINELDQLQINSIYYGKYLLYTNIINEQDVNTFLQFDNNNLLKDKIDINCIIKQEDIKYFYCLKYDSVRLTLVIYYLKKYCNIDFNTDIVDKSKINDIDDIQFIESHCFNLIKNFYNKYKLYIYDKYTKYYDKLKEKNDPTSSEYPDIKEKNDLVNNIYKILNEDINLITIIDTLSYYPIKNTFKNRNRLPVDYELESIKKKYIKYKLKYLSKKN